MSHTDELEEYDAELELRLKREYADVFPLFRFCVLTQEATYLCNRFERDFMPQASYPFFHITMEDVWVWDKNRPTRIIPRAEVYTSFDGTRWSLAGTVTGTGTVQAPPDLATLMIGVTTQGETAEVMTATAQGHVIGHKEILRNNGERLTRIALYVPRLEDGKVRVFFDAPPESPTVRGYAGILAAGLDGDRRGRVAADRVGDQEEADHPGLLLGRRGRSGGNHDGLLDAEASGGIEHVGAHQQVVEHRHVREESPALRHQNDAMAHDLHRTGLVESRAVERDGAGADEIEVGERIADVGVKAR